MFLNLAPSRGTSWLRSKLCPQLLQIPSKVGGLSEVPGGHKRDKHMLAAEQESGDRCLALLEKWNSENWRASSDD